MEIENKQETPIVVPIQEEEIKRDVIGREQIWEARQVLEKYKEGKKNLEDRIIQNEQWYKLRHWECMRTIEARKNGVQQIQPTSAWLFNSIANKHADAMDSFPCPNVLPREASDKEQAKTLSSILPVILEQNDFEKVYSDVMTYKLRSGTGVYGVFWDGAKHNGLGDISIKKVDLLNLFWESGITDIQESENLFNVELVNNDILVAKYPELKDRLGSPSFTVGQYFYDDNVDTSNKSAVID